MPRLDALGICRKIGVAADLDCLEYTGFSDDSWPNARHGSARGSLGKDPTPREPARETAGL